MTMRRKAKFHSRRLLGIEPWSATGPGWSNSGLHFIWEVNEWHYSEKIPELRARPEIQYVYRRELPKETRDWIDVLAVAYGKLEPLAYRRKRGEKRRRP